MEAYRFYVCLKLCEIPKATGFTRQMFCLRLQMLQRVVVVAAESLKLLEHQLMDREQIQDVRVG